jgi:hypothetical protein
MHSETPAARRLIYLLLLLSALVFAQTTSLASEHLHQHSSQHCCGLCHSGPLPFVQPAIAANVAPMLSVAWLENSSGLDTPHEVILTAGSSRAPPA